MLQTPQSYVPLLYYQKGMRKRMQKRRDTRPLCLFVDSKCHLSQMCSALFSVAARHASLKASV